MCVAWSVHMSGMPRWCLHICRVCRVCGGSTPCQTQFEAEEPGSLYKTLDLLNSLSVASRAVSRILSSIRVFRPWTVDGVTNGAATSRSAEPVHGWQFPVNTVVCSSVKLCQALILRFVQFCPGSILVGILMTILLSKSC